MAENNQQPVREEMTQEQISEQSRIRRDKLKELQQAGKDPFEITKYDVTHHTADIKENYAELEGTTVRIAGRMMSKRVMGKASFCNIADLKGNIQSYVARDSIGVDFYQEFKRMDIGDIVGIFTAIDHWSVGNCNFTEIFSQTAVAAHKQKRHIHLIVDGVTRLPFAFKNSVTILYRNSSFNSVQTEFHRLCKS